MYRIDSIYIHEYSSGDTVYVDRYRDRVRYRTLHTCDTVYQTREQIRTLPPERYTPRAVKILAYIGGIALLLLVIRCVIQCIMKNV